MFFVAFLSLVFFFFFFEKGGGRGGLLRKSFKRNHRSSAFSVAGASRPRPGGQRLPELRAAEAPRARALRGFGEAQGAGRGEHARAEGGGAGAGGRLDVFVCVCFLEGTVFNVVQRERNLMRASIMGWDPS